MTVTNSKLPRIGVDLAKISRFEGKQTLAKKILSPEEFIQYQGHPQPGQFLASRFAAKEAFIKAYRLPPMPALPTIIVGSDADGAPFIQFQKKRYALSISHDGEYAIAMVIM